MRRNTALVVLLLTGILMASGCTGWFARDALLQPQHLSGDTERIRSAMAVLLDTAIPEGTPNGVENKIQSALQRLERALVFLEDGKTSEAFEIIGGVAEQLSESVEQVLSLRCSQKRGPCIPDDEALELVAALRLARDLLLDNQIPETTAVLDVESLDCLVEVSADGRILAFDCVTPFLQQLDVGDYVVAGVCTEMPFGFLGEATSIYEIGGQLILETAPATLQDLLNYGTVHVSGTLSEEDLLSPQLAARTEAIDLADPLEFSYTLDTVLYDHDGDPATDDDQIVAHGTIDFSLAYEFEVEFGWFSIERFAFTATTSEVASFDVEGDIALVSVDYSKELWRHYFTPITVMVGPIPVVIVPLVTITVGVNGDVTVGVTCGVDQRADLIAGVAFEDGSWGLIQEFTYDFDYREPVVTATCLFRGYARPELSLLLYGVAGACANVEGYLEFDADISREPRWQLYGGLGAHVGVEIDVLGHGFGYESPDLVGLRILLAQANMSPIAGVSAAPESGPAPLTVHFDASSSGDPDGTVVSYAWDLGDGSTALGEELDYTFGSPGEYTVVLTIVDDQGATDTAATEIAVQAGSSPGDLSWSLHTTTAPEELIREIAMVTPSEGWATASVVYGYTYKGRIYYYNGSDWTLHTLTQENIILHAIDMVSVNDGWAAGEPCYIYHYDGSNWTLHTNLKPPVGGSGIRCIDMVSCDEGWAVGYYGRIYYYDGSVWMHHMTTPEKDSLYALAMLSEDSGWACGQNGRIYRYDGTGWFLHTTLSSVPSFMDIYAHAEDDVWAVGLDGRICHYNGADWSLHSNTFEGEDLYDVEMVSANDGWICGRGGLIYRYDGSTWFVHSQMPEGLRLDALDMVTGVDGWAGGWGGVLYHGYELGG